MSDNKKFHPAQAIDKKYTTIKPGINWTWVEGMSKEDAESFLKACQNNHFRAEMHPSREAEGRWDVRYHHYQD